MGSLSLWHWLIVLVVVALIFGTGKLKNMGKDLGGAIKGFKEGMNSNDDADEHEAGIEGSASSKVEHQPHAQA